MSGFSQPPGGAYSADSALGYGPRGPSDDRLWALLSYLLTMVASLIAPLVIFLVKMNESRYVRFHAAQSLNMGITAAVYSVGGVVVAIFTHGWALLVLVPLFIVFVVAHLVYLILAAVAANRGELYRVPPVLCLPMVR